MLNFCRETKRYGNKNTVELQWLEQAGNHENMFETGVVGASES